MQKPDTTEARFSDLGIAPKIIEILTRKGFVHPTPIQRQAIPVGLEGKDVIGVAQTGTGKTLAFGIPMLQRIASTKKRGLVVLPTRELAVQVNEALHGIGREAGLKTAILIGGEDIKRQIRQLRERPHIIIATPGRLIDHLEQKTVTLTDVGILVLDEADRMLDMGFEPQIRQVLKTVPTARQTMLFSATMPPEIVDIAKKYMQQPLRVEVAPPGTTAQLVTQELYFVDRNQKQQLLKKLLAEGVGPTLVFTRTKFGAKKLARYISRWGHGCAEIHSNRSLNQRLEALNGFKVGKYRVLVATDIAARGIDVTGIELVVNFDLPQSADDYVHRIGRTARAGRAGRAVSFATPDQKSDVRDIERLIKKQLPVNPLPELPREEREEYEQRPERSFGGGRGGDRRQPPRRGGAPGGTPQRGGQHGRGGFGGDRGRGGRAERGPRPGRDGRGFGGGDRRASKPGEERKGPFNAPKSKRDRKRYNEPVKMPSWFKGLRTSENPTWLTLKDL